MVKRTLKKVLKVMVKAIGIFAIMYVAFVAILTAVSVRLIPNEEENYYGDDYYDEEIARED